MPTMGKKKFEAAALQRWPCGRVGQESRGLRSWWWRGGRNRLLRRGIALRRKRRGRIRRRRDAASARTGGLRRSPPRQSAVACRLHRTFKFLRKLFPGKKQTRFYRADWDRKQRGDFLERVALHCREQK